jgi:CHAD domain-containing protein
MGFKIRHDESIGAALHRIATDQISACINDLRLRQPDTHEAVHDFRKRCKKLRGLLRLVRPQLGSQFRIENATFRDLSRELSFERDAQALLEALDRLLVRFASEVSMSTVQPVRDQLTESRDALAGGEDQLVAKLEEMIGRVEAARDRVRDWPTPPDEFESVAGGLEKTYRRARRGMRIAYDNPSLHNFHEWRKRVKYHWHHALLLRQSCPMLLKPHRKLAENLGEKLGQDHDYGVLRERLVDLRLGDEFERAKAVVVDLIDRRQEELRAEMRPLGAVLQAEAPKQLIRRWGTYWQTWRGDSDE